MLALTFSWNYVTLDLRQLTQSIIHKTGVEISIPVVLNNPRITWEIFKNIPA